MEESRRGIRKRVDLLLTELNSPLVRHLIAEPTQFNLPFPALKVN